MQNAKKWRSKILWKITFFNGDSRCQERIRCAICFFVVLHFFTISVDLCERERLCVCMSVPNVDGFCFSWTSRTAYQQHSPMIQFELTIIHFILVSLSGIHSMCKHFYHKLYICFFFFGKFLLQPSKMCIVHIRYCSGISNKPKI